MASLEGRQPIFRVPGIVIWLIAGLALAHGARMLASPTLSDRILGEYAFIPARYSSTYLAALGINPGTLFERAVPFVSYMALHGGLTHLAINCLWLLAFGPVVARRFGGGLFALFFLACGIAAAATHLALNWGSPVPVIGASGAISGLMAAGMRILPTLTPATLAPATSAPGEIRLAPIFSRQILIFTLIWVAVNVVTGLSGFGTGGEIGLIAWQAHLGGYFAGLLLAGLFDALRPRVGFG